MEGSARITNTPALINRIDRLRDELIKHFEALVAPTGLERPSRSATAIAQYHVQVETAALIRATEDFQALIRELQEMWLFGQLNTAGQSTASEETIQNAKAIGDLLTQLLERNQAGTLSAPNEAEDKSHDETVQEESMAED